MSKKVFVAKINFQTTEETLKEYFEKVGTVESAKIIKDYESGRSKGFGFVEFSSAEEAQEAISTLNNTELDERTIVVSEARERQDRRR